ncbi:LacI family DNA-binding transcriptional regulator [Cellulomonas denverensis]|uniref:LacI family transcriptional regulator n=1 Tax=Cellulomonas denverensis TaxID=264297 RepID=A0A7X6QZQ1_9CELL|nr:substrate-binding domain-containing protein [Cellulomonas denverensis]NKY23499.1 LacI family transcriptional regulator [Cellulomonas denverensis]GIG25017.1 LacI family transcriptional regulator [Cellulomonas denverensis]
MTSAPGRRATLSDVAAAAGVSKATASKALNGRDDVSADTRERVLDAVTAVGYRPTTDPRHPRDRRTLAVVFSLPASPYILGVFQGALAAATDAHADLLTRMAPDRPTRTQAAGARDWIADLRAAGVDAVVGLTLSVPDTLIRAAQEAGLPFVVVDPVDTRDRQLVSIGSSNWDGARTATDHLIGLGHRRIGWIGGPETSDAARERLYGYFAALDAAGLVPDPALIRCDQFTVGNGTRHAHDLLTAEHPPTAIMAADDELAVGTLAAAHALGIRVPDQLSICGFDDTPQAAWTTPPLTTVHQHLDDMGRIAVRTALAMCDGQAPASPRIELATSLTVRGSTGAAAG